MKDCETCGGTGESDESETCDLCSGSGRIGKWDYSGYNGPDTDCSKCYGTGRLKKRCSVCEGTGKVKE